MVKVGDRVRCKSVMFEGTGVVFYIDHPSLYTHHLLPIQVELDEPDPDGHRMKRFSLKEVEVIE
jgi:hypothetical protein